MRIGFLGLGSMGKPMARNLLGLGHILTVYSRTPGKASELIAKGAKEAVTIADAVVDAEVVITLLPDDAAMTAVAYGPGGMLKNLPQHSIHLCMSSISVEKSAELVFAHADAGQGYVAAPVFGKVEDAENRNLWIMAGGPEPQVNRCLPIFIALGRGLTRVGPKAALAHALKQGCNAMAETLAEILPDMLASCERAQVPPADYLRFLDSAVLKIPLLDVREETIPPPLADPEDLSLDSVANEMLAALQAASGPAQTVPVAEPPSVRTKNKRDRGKDRHRQEPPFRHRPAPAAPAPMPPPVAVRPPFIPPKQVPIASAPPAPAPPKQVPNASAPLAPAPPKQIPNASAPPAPAPPKQVPIASAPPAPASPKQVPNASAPLAPAPQKQIPNASAPPSPAVAEAHKPPPPNGSHPPAGEPARTAGPSPGFREGNARGGAADAGRAGGPPAPARAKPSEDLSQPRAGSRAESPSPPPPPEKDPATVSRQGREMMSPAGDQGTGLPQPDPAGMFTATDGDRSLMLDLNLISHFELVKGKVWAWSQGKRYGTSWAKLSQVELAFQHTLFLSVQRHILLRPEAVLDLRSTFGGGARARVEGGLELDISRAAAPRLRMLL